MSSTTRARRRNGRPATLVLAAALLAAPAAQARTDPTTGTRVPTDSPVVVVEANDGFDWADAGLGAGTAAGIVLLAGATAAAVTHRRRVRAAH
jgi:hypothetical protein